MEVAVPKLISETFSVRPLMLIYSIAISFQFSVCYGSIGKSVIIIATAAVPLIVARTVDTNTGG